MRQLPFDDGSFDRVVSHWAVHNLPSPGERARAIREMVRVVRPGGHVVLADIQFRQQYAAELRTLGLIDVRHSVRRLRDVLLAIATCGHFRPATTTAKKVASRPAAHGT
jgi:ubiquinone/menaquinone biosynthesis C-methylase UbiE